MIKSTFITDLSTLQSTPPFEDVSVKSGVLKGESWKILEARYNSEIVEIQEEDGNKATILFADGQQLALKRALRKSEISMKSYGNEEDPQAGRMILQEVNWFPIIVTLSEKHNPVITNIANNQYIEVPSDWTASFDISLVMKEYSINPAMEYVMAFFRDHLDLLVNGYITIPIDNLCPPECPRKNDLITTGFCCQFATKSA